MQLSTAVVAIAMVFLLAGDFGGLFGDGDTVQGPIPQAASQEVQSTTEPVPEAVPAPVDQPSPPEAPSSAASEAAPAAPVPQQVMPAPAPDVAPMAEEEEADGGEVAEDASRQGEALEGQDVAPQVAPGEQKPAEALEPEKEGDGSVVRKIQIGVGAFLGMLAAATGYAMFRRRRA